MVTHSKFSTKIRYKARIVLLTFPSNFVLEVFANAIRQENKIKGIQTVEEIESPVFVSSFSSILYEEYSLRLTPFQVYILENDRYLIPIAPKQLPKFILIRPT